jgi:uncharacterized membrane protein
LASLSQAKVFGGVGAILVFIPFLSLVGYILIIVAVRDISKDLQDKTIFRNVVIAALTGIVGALAGGLIFIDGIIGASGGAAVAATRVAALLTGLGVVWIFLIFSAFFLRRAYNSMAVELGVGTFKTAGTLYLVGAALTVILVGFLLLLVAQILQAVAYFSIPDRPPTQGMGASGGTAAAPPP